MKQFGFLVAFSVWINLEAICETHPPKTFNIAERGAKGDGLTLNTKAIQSVIEECSKGGGGTIIIPAGIFVSGSLFLKPGVSLEFKEGAILKGSTDINDYPKINTRIEGHFEPWRAALINGDRVDHLRITGKGTLDGSGKPFWLKFWKQREIEPKVTNLAVERPRLALIQNSKDVQISGIHFLNSGFWNLHLYRCEKVVVGNCRFEAPAVSKPDNHAPSSDGIDVDSSRDIVIKDCWFSVGDDCIALKGSKGPMAMNDKNSPPVEKITIEDCVFEKGGGIMTCGSEATIVRNVHIRRCITKGPTVLRLKLRPDTPQQYEDITLDDITLENGGVIFKVSPWTQFFDLKGQEPPTALVRDIRISNIRGNASSFGEISGHDKATIRDITVRNADLKLSSSEFKVGKVEDLRFENVKVNGMEMPSPAEPIQVNRVSIKSNQ